MGKQGGVLEHPADNGGGELRERKSALRSTATSTSAISSMLTRSPSHDSSVEDLLRLIDEKRNGPLEPLSKSEIQAVKLREIAGWFIDSQTNERLDVSEVATRLKRDNAMEWIAWAFFHERLAELRSSGVQFDHHRSPVSFSGGFTLYLQHCACTTRSTRSTTIASHAHGAHAPHTTLFHFGMTNNKFVQEKTQTATATAKRTRSRMIKSC